MWSSHLNLSIVLKEFYFTLDWHELLFDRRNEICSVFHTHTQLIQLTNANHLAEIESELIERIMTYVLRIQDNCLCFRSWCNLYVAVNNKTTLRSLVTFFGSIGSKQETVGWHVLWFWLGSVKRKFIANIRRFFQHNSLAPLQ